MWLILGCTLLRCVDYERTDNKNIIYKELKKE